MNENNIFEVRLTFARFDDFLCVELQITFFDFGRK